MLVRLLASKHAHIIYGCCLFARKLAIIYLLLRKEIQKTMNIIESYNLQKDKENKYNYSNTYTNELNTYFSNYIKAKKKLREQQEQKQLESELIQNINQAIENSFK